MKNRAPVLICTLNRYVHFKRCVESLASCTHASETDLFIGFDYPAKSEHWEGYKLIKEYLPRIFGFKSVNITEQITNVGRDENWFSMQRLVLDQYDRIIISEDDNEFSSNFLDFVNKGL